MSEDRNATANGRTSVGEIVLVGPIQKFSRTHIRLLHEQHPAIQLTERRDVDSLLVDGFNDQCRLVLVDESECESVLDHAKTFAQQAGRVRIAMTYGGQMVDHDCMRRCIASRAVNSFLPMDMHIETWISAVDLLLHGGRYMPPSVVDELLLCPAPTRSQVTNADQASEIDALTKREWEVLELVAQGHQNKHIAFQLNLSQNTIKQHLHHIITKLNATNRTEAAVCYHVHMALQRSSGHVA